MYIFRNDYCRYWGYMLTFQSPCVCWRIPNTNWRAHTELCHRNPDTFKRPGTMLNQSRYPSQLRGNAHLCKLKTTRTVESFNHREKNFLSFQTNHYFFIYVKRIFIYKKNNQKLFEQTVHRQCIYVYIIWLYFIYSAFLIL